MVGQTVGPVFRVDDAGVKVVKCGDARSLATVIGGPFPQDLITQAPSIRSGTRDQSKVLQVG